MEFQKASYYEDVAKKMKFQTKALINGRFASASDGGTFASISPIDGRYITDVASCTIEDAEHAVKAARAAFEDGRWSRMNPAERKRILLRLASLIREHAEELAIIETLDSGKPIYDNLTGDIPETANTFAYHAEAIDKLQDRMTAGDGEHVSMVVRESIGVVAAIVPWNFPIQMASWKLGPILAAGNCAVIKPAKLTSLSLLRVAELAMDAGIPNGVLNILPGSGALIGDYLAKHPDVDCVTFTGSTEVGKQLLGLSGGSNAKRVFLEMGGKNPCIVMPDVKDLDHAAEEAVSAVFWNMGENCTSNSRLLVHSSIKDALLEKVIEKAKEWKTGNPFDSDNHLGALIEKKHMEKVLNYIDIAKKEGGKCVLGGTQLYPESGGNYVAPTIFDGITPDMTIAKEEIFGPVLGVMTFDSEEEAIRIANDTEYGLQASLFTDDLKTANRMARALRAGTVSVNCYSEGDLTTPFGGFKQSGFFGRDKSVWANTQYTELKTIWMQL